jgi:hypothetical protein
LGRELNALGHRVKLIPPSYRKRAETKMRRRAPSIVVFVHRPRRLRRALRIQGEQPAERRKAAAALTTIGGLKANPLQISAPGFSTVLTRCPADVT